MMSAPVLGEKREAGEGQGISLGNTFWEMRAGGGKKATMKRHSPRVSQPKTELSSGES